MHHQIPVWQLVLSSLQRNIPVMLLYVLDSSGSSPGRQGFGMSVNAIGEMEGSIGGGIMEHKFVEMGRDFLQRDTLALQPVMRKQVHDKSSSKNQSGMICSGEQTNFLYRPGYRDMPAIETLVQTLEINGEGSLVFSPEGFQFLKTDPTGLNVEFTFHNENDWLYREKVGHKNFLYIIGGGHCSLAFSKIMSMMDFHISVYDTRDGLNTMDRNDYVHEKYIIDDFSRLPGLIPPGENRFVVIMTVGYRTDEIAVKSLLSQQYAYLGLLGSGSKIKKLLSDLEKDGFSQGELKRIHAPVGLPVNSQTPEEIAISIAAEIIQVKNRRLKGKG